MRFRLYCYIVTYADSHTCTYICRIIHNDTRLLYKYIYLSLYCKGSKRVIQGLRVRGSWRPNITAIYWPPHSYDRQRCLSRSPDAQPEALGWWLSLLHLISIFSGPQLIWAPRAPSAWCGFPFHISSITPSHLSLQLQLLSWLSYIILQCPLSRLLDLWNRMFDRHPAEITVMQFTGHSLPMRQSMSVPWEFFYLVPFHQPISAHAISSHNCH